ncbi:LysR family transcriptional regulator [Oceanicola sp. 22II-s10i]|uniref:LysR family transcriptional regulator n=1 Tax=Oceanicola sp. 22II-s10i TaxID=1317116 RepID=UPI000B52144D|nr:LysR family transcriptional regulator [Oceanicola sp. 22II-s10i]OWU85550.1 LysR family transcriptional regulator [Oceanicola sp. 22II-s10i]
MDWIRLPPLTALRAFAAYVDAGGMAAAGARLNVSHAAISQQIRALEEYLGLTLLDRSGRAGSLTDAGRTLSEALLAGFDRIEKAVDELTGADADRPVQVTTTPAFASNWLMPRLGGFRATNPGVSLMIDPSPELRELRPGGLDIAVRYGSGEWPGLEADLLIETPIVIVAAPSLVGEEAFTEPADLTRFHWMQEVGTNEASEFLERHGAVLDRARGLTSLPGNLMIEAAREGQGIAVSAGAFVEADVAAGRLRLLFEDRRKKGYYLVTRPGVMRPAARMFHRWLLSQSRDRD